MEKETISIEQDDLRLFLEVFKNGLSITSLPRDVRNRFKKLLEEELEWADAIEEAI